MNENKKRNVPLPQAKAGDGWAALWQSPEARDTPHEWENREPRITKRPSLMVASTVRGDLSPIGLGNVQLCLSDLPLASDPSSAIAAIAGASTSVGSAQCVGRAWLHELLEETPLKGKLPSTASRIERTVRAIDEAKRFPRGSASTYKFSVPDMRWQFMALVAWQSMPDTYGLVWIPKGSEEHLIPADPTNLPEQRELTVTHVLVDVLKTKHSLMRELGFLDAIELDQRLIENALTKHREKAA